MPDTNELLINISALLPGDILLHRANKQKFHRKLISSVTESPYTHASIFYGNGQIAEATHPKIRINKLSPELISCDYIGVLRSQMVFSEQRQEVMCSFIDELIEQNAKYDFSGVVQFSKRKKTFFENIIQNIHDNFGKVTSKEEFAKQTFFCSALIVACYSVVGIIGDNAQIAYPPNVFSPGDLYRDPTFGWLLGYLVPEGKQVPEDDPLRSLTLWCDQQDKWWM